MLADLFFRLRSVFRRRNVEKELEEELRFHYAAQKEKYLQKGLTPEEAMRHFRLDFGGLNQVKEECRDARGVSVLQNVAQDLRYAMRMIRKSPGFTIAAVVLLAAGIGANTAIFSVVEDVLLRPLPYKHAGRLVDVTEYMPGKVDSAGVPFPDYLAWRQATSSFENMAAYFLIRASNDIVLGGPFSAERARYSTVSNSFFGILGVQPALGHGFSRADELPGGPRVFLISDALWRSSFGGDLRALGRPYLLDGESYTLVGVMPAGFDFPKGCGVWVPLGTLGETGMHDRVSHPFHVLGRLRPGVNLIQAEKELGYVQSHLGGIYPNTDADWRVRARPLLDEITGNVRTSLFVLLGAVGFTLLIACTNVMNLLLARASACEREFSIRASLGAGRVRLLCQNLTETALLVSMSLVIAVAVANWGLKLISLLAPYQLPRAEPFHLSVPVLLFMASIATMTSILVGIVPALQISRQGMHPAFHSRRRGTSPDPSGRHLRDGLVVSEVALALVLLCGAGLMLRSFTLLNRVDPGFETDHLITLKIALPGAAYAKAEQTEAFLDRLREGVKSLPGVTDAALASAVPLSGESEWNTFQIPEHGTADWAHAPAADARAISVTYFRTLGIPMVRGRDFTAAEARSHVIIINQTMAIKFWPGTNPIGQHIVSIDDRSNPLQIVGVVRDVRSFGPRSESKPEMYTPYRGAWYMNLVVRTKQDSAAMSSAVRQQVAALDKGVPVYQVATIRQFLSRSVAPERFETFLLALLAPLAVTLSAVGLYGVVSFTVSRRIPEIGIRLALGAQRQEVFALIVRQGAGLVIVGLTLGLVASFCVTRLMASLLYHVSATDPLIFCAVAMVLAIVALGACCIPARRAMQVDPIMALKFE